MDTRASYGNLWLNWSIHDDFCQYPGWFECFGTECWGRGILHRCWWIMKRKCLDICTLRSRYLLRRVGTFKSQYLNLTISKLTGLVDVLLRKYTQHVVEQASIWWIKNLVSILQYRDENLLIQDDFSWYEDDRSTFQTDCNELGSWPAVPRIWSYFWKIIKRNLIKTMLDMYQIRIQKSDRRHLRILQ